MATVRIRSDLPAGVEMRVDEMVAHPDLPHQTVARVKSTFVLRPGHNDVDAEIWREWLAQHQGDELAKHLKEETD